MSHSSHYRIGRALVTLVASVLLIDGALQLASAPPIEAALDHIGFAPATAPQLAVVTLSCAICLLFRATWPLGAILTTGFFGGAICAHLRIGELGTLPQWICVILGLMMWGGLALADGRFRSLLAPSDLPRRATMPVVAGRLDADR